VITVTAVEFQRNFARYQDAALTAPVTISHHGRERLVMLSAEEYQRLTRRARAVMPVGLLSDRDLAAIAEADVPAEYAGLDRELE
jgi:prevent-host-death family protein